MFIAAKYDEIFKNSFIDINIDHDEALKAFKNIKTDDKFIFINFDTHSDIYINTISKRENLANWINFCLSYFSVKKSYWVLPDYIMQNKEIIQNMKEQSYLSPGALIYFNGTMTKCEKKLYLLNDTNELITEEKIKFINEKCKEFSIPEIIDIKTLKDIDLTACFAECLPDFKDKKVLLSVDADYFCNTGYDTLGNLNNKNISPCDLEEEFKNFLNILYEKNIRPVAASLTLSPVYTPEKYRNLILDFFERIKRINP